MIFAPYDAFVSFFFTLEIKLNFYIASFMSFVPRLCFSLDTFLLLL